MRDCGRFYLDGQWVLPAAPRPLDVINPATEAVAGFISLCIFPYDTEDEAIRIEVKSVFGAVHA